MPFPAPPSFPAEPRQPASSMRGRRTEWHSTLAAPDFPEDAYEHLFTRISTLTPFNRLAWLRAAEAVAPHGSLSILVQWQDDEMLACLPLVRQRKPLLAVIPLTTIHHLGYPLTDRLGLAILDKSAMSLGGLLREIQIHQPSACIEWNDIFREDTPENVFADFALRNCCFRQTSITCSVPEHWLQPDSTEEGKLADKVRYELRRARRRADEVGAHIERVVPDGKSMEAWLSRLIEIEQASWKGNEGLGIFSGDMRQKWMGTALCALASEGRVRIVTMCIGEQCISYRLGLLEKNRLYDYNIAFLPDFAKLGSGRLLLDEWIRWAADEGWHVVDASRISRRSSHQLHERMNGQLVQYRERLFSRRPSGWLLGSAQRLWLQIKPLWQAAKQRRKK